VSGRAACLLALALAARATSAGAAAEASPVAVQVKSEKAEVSVGEPFTIELKALGPAGTTFTFPGEASNDSLELRSAPETAAVPGAGTPPPAEPGVHRYQATCFALGEVQIPAIPVRYRLPDGTAGEAASAPLTLKVGSLLPKDPAQQKLADVRGPVMVSIGRAFWITLVLALLALGAVAYALLRRRRKPASVSAPAAPELSPADEAQGALDALASQNLPGRGEYRAFYIALAVVSKRYLERRLAAPVLEMTSAETLAFLRGHAHGGELLPIVRDLAEAADRIKFARGDGLADEARRHLVAVRGLVKALEERLRPALIEKEGKAA
jgi:hypothetical protein